MTTGEECFGPFEKVLSDRNMNRLKKEFHLANDLWAKGERYHAYFTLHGPNHFVSVINIISQLLAKNSNNSQISKKRISNDDLFLLLSSAIFHDIGMISDLSKKEKEQINIDGISESDWIRKHHHKRSSSYVIENYKKLGLNDIEKEYVAQLCEFHRSLEDCNFFNSQLLKPSKQSLAALLRISDELDITNNRTPDILLRELWSGMDKVSKWHWIKHWVVKKGEVLRSKRVETPNETVIRFNYIIQLPNSKYESLLWDQIFGPIKNAMIKENINLYLKKFSIEIETNSFEKTIFLREESFSDDETLTEIFSYNLDDTERSVDIIYHETLDDSDFMNIIAKSQKKMYERVLNLTSDFNVDKEGVLTVIRKYINSYKLNPSNSAFEEANREILTKDVNANSLIKMEILNSIEPMRRIMQFISSGGRIAKQSYLNYCFQSCKEGLSDLYAWVVENEGDVELIKLAVRFLVKENAQEYSELILRTSKHQDSGVRLECANAMATLYTTGTIKRLSSMVDFDLDKSVRDTAFNSLEVIMQNRKSPHHFGKHKYKVFFFSEEKPQSISIIDRLANSGIEIEYINVLDDIVNKTVSEDKILIMQLDTNRRTFDSNYLDTINQILQKNPTLNLIIASDIRQFDINSKDLRNVFFINGISSNDNYFNKLTTILAYIQSKK